MDSLDPFLANLNPIIRYSDIYHDNINDFLSSPPGTMASTIPGVAGQGHPKHYLRIVSPINAEELAIYPSRLPQNRGNNYLGPAGKGSPLALAQGGFNFESHDCANTNATGGLGSGQVTYNPPSTPTPSTGTFPLNFLPVPVTPGSQAFGACVLAPDFPASLGGGRVPYVPRDP
jgi:phospholipid/cholesterol/gamma-HCH transport system substrate-binding protein